MGWLPPFPQDLWDLSGRDRLSIDSTHDNVVCSGIADLGFLVVENPTIKARQLVAKLTNSTSGEVTEIPFCETSVFAGDLHLTRKGQIVANEDPRAGNEASRVSLIV
jgi:hypothetical protein